MRRIHSLLLSGLLGLSGLGAAAVLAAGENTTGVTSQQAAFFEAKVRPLLAERCFSCHGAKVQQSGLRLDTRQGLLKGGARGPALIPGDSENSRLLQALRYDGSLKMPPAGRLRNDEIAALTEWVKQGAPWPDTLIQRHKDAKTQHATLNTHWAFQPLKRVPPPPIQNPKSKIQNPIDAFILAKLRAKGLTPNPPADRRTLIRRATYDLLGLPPTPEEVEAFVQDRRPDAYERLIDRLLASPHYGERWGRHWLDVARYADSNGLDENKAFANAFRYRDYVIAAFNKDKPYDQFILEQLAGDLLPTDDEEVRNERITATGFLALGAKVLAEQDKPKMVMDIVDEQIEVTGKAFLGLTLSCARCHDHKFDPISMQDYYALAGIFKSTRTMKDLGFVSNWLERPLMTKALEAQVRAHEQKVQAVQTERKAIVDGANADLRASLRREAGRYLRAGWELAQQPGAVSVAETPAKPGDPPRIVVEAEQFDRGNLARDFQTYGAGIGVIHNINTPDEAEWDISVPTAGAYLVELRYAAAESRPVRLLLNGQVIRERTAGQVTGSWQPDGQRWEPQGVFRFAAGKNTLRIECEGPIPHFDKLLIVPAPNGGPSAPRTAEEIAGQHHLHPALVQRWAAYLQTVKETPAFRAWRDMPDTETEQAVLRTAQDDPKGPLSLPEKPESYYPDAVKAALKKADDALNAAQAQAPSIPMAMAVEEGRIENVRVHLRGSTLTLGEEAPRRFPTVLAGDRQTPIDDKRSGRLELAQWLIRPDHPLTARVIVNRVWQHHFGEGLVRTPDNFGWLGEKPSHPELLDWLAATFQSRGGGRGSRDLPATLDPRLSTFDYSCGWSLKKLHRLIMLSDAYRRSSANDPKALAIDPDNRYLWRMNRRRLEAEPFRDALLAVSGKLDRTMGGSLLTTPNNEYVTNDQSANAARYDNHRRSVYLPIIRNALYDMFQAFDVGDPSAVNAKRASTTVAPQALFVMNSAFVLEQSRAFAADLLARASLSDAERVNLAYQRAFARPASAAETKRALAFVARYEAALAPMEPDARKRRARAWQSLCQTLFASNEFIYVD